jgi:hypothetical protein
VVRLAQQLCPSSVTKVTPPLPFGGVWRNSTERDQEHHRGRRHPATGVVAWCRPLCRRSTNCARAGSRPTIHDLPGLKHGIGDIGFAWAAWIIDLAKNALGICRSSTKVSAGTLLGSLVAPNDGTRIGLLY